MTHAREKSDSAIVAEKPTNKVEQSTAEPAEPRADSCKAKEEGEVHCALPPSHDRSA
jgi:hypothetical protein